MHAPHFWRNDPSWFSRLLAPFSFLWRLGYKLRRMGLIPYHAPIPIICIGNLVAGGAGKTPVALAVAKLLPDKKIFFLTRGYGGKHQGPLRVDAATHSFEQVGDEALLLAAAAPTIMSKQRVAGAKLATEQGADIIIMDDGFQNHTLHKDISLLVVDGTFGFGNERVIPAGPLREPVRKGMKRTQAVIVIGEDTANVAQHVPEHIPTIHARVNVKNNHAELRGKKVFAFAGIARPEKFYVTLQTLGCDITGLSGYPDHYRYTERDMTQLRERAKAQGALLVTTAKDAARLPADFCKEVTIIDIEATFGEKETLEKLLREVVIA